MTDRLVDALRGTVGDAHVLVESDVVASYETDWTGRFHGAARCVVRPGSTEEVADVLTACSAMGAAVVPQGGLTGLVGGSVPRGGEVVLSTRRLDAIELDAEHGEVVVGAGSTLSAVRSAARAEGWDVPVDLGSRDSATIGGMVATNAGGEHVVRYGAMQHQLIGVEAVLSDGRVVGPVPGLRKDNTGYHWPGILAGSEGTLGVVTRVHTALVPQLRSRAVALVAVGSVADAVALAGHVRRTLDSVLSLELFLAEGLALVREHRDIPAPFVDDWPAYLLVECGAQDEGRACTDQLTRVLADRAEVRDSAIGADPATRERLWAYRELHTESIHASGVPHKLDVTLPFGALASFVDEVVPAVASIAPRARVVVFGHVGDGNLHVNVLGLDPGDDHVDHAVLRLVAQRGGSISAEHGIGIAKRADLPLVRTPDEIDAMRAIKQALDPAGILNPGVIFATPAVGAPTLRK